MEKVQNGDEEDEMKSVRWNERKGKLTKVEIVKKKSKCRKLKQAFFKIYDIAFCI